ncbi:TetR/AcrR family transcriptional regulator [Gordonia sp. X0973]|uniref:TetR/AcrR family transcriptional regulator n=1 Tax=Gordonia sp. X0973 TaxID=2742602 RepID=UPI000F52AD4F|nr:TetR/AcrR family transcriptional regulator [Gordonia sp. X0973]QKT06092.1 TetR/AcrR family transcriptional regulator [Gordonia sp. X0973]
MERERLVDVGVSLVSRFGTKALSLTSVAKHAGVARATAYRMFGGREELIAAIVEREVAQLRARLNQWSAAQPDAEGKVRVQVVESLRYIREHEALQYMLRNEPAEIVEALVSTNDGGPALITQIVSAALPDVDEEVAHRLRPSPEAAAEFIVRVVYSLMLVPDSAMTDEEVADLVVAAIIAPA